jgi:acetyl-CoA acetyltransferase family protein
VVAVRTLEEAVIVDAVRTPLGRRGGKLKDWHPVDLAAEVLRALVERNDLDPAQVDDVLMGCLDQVGEQGVNIGRVAALAAGFPDTVPGTTVDRQCGSSQQTAHFAAQGIMAGAYDVAIAAGVESMTRVPFWSTVPDPSQAYGPRFRARYGLGPDEWIDQGVSGEIVADKWEIGREELDALALESHHRAHRATTEGRFAREIIPVTVVTEDGEQTMAADEGIRADSSMEALAKLRTVFREDGKLTAGNSSQITDGAAALLVMSARKAEELGMTPLARFHAFAVAGVDPIEMLSGPIPATRKIFERSGLGVDDIDLFEVNEAFASVPLAWQREIGADMGRVNVNGGAIALGHPVGASGARLMTTLVHEMQRTEARFGLQTMCEGGGMANATILERL